MAATKSELLDFLEKMYDEWGYNLRSDYFVEIRRLLREVGRLKVESLRGEKNGAFQKKVS